MAKKRLRELLPGNKIKVCTYNAPPLTKIVEETEVLQPAFKDDNGCWKIRTTLGTFDLEEVEE